MKNQGHELLVKEWKAKFMTKVNEDIAETQKFHIN
jgi:hypothetical protein